MEKYDIKICTKDSIKNIKNDQSVITYVELLQNAISRMAGNSANTKAIIGVVYTVFATILVTQEQLKCYWWIGLIITFLGMIMDIYYLALERMYRKKYNKFIEKLNQDQIDIMEIYNMNPKSTELKYEVLAVMLEAAKSFSIIGFYIVFVVISILLKFI